MVYGGVMEIVTVFFFENWVSGVSPAAEQKTGQSDRKRNW